MTNLKLHKFVSLAVFFCFLYRCTPNLRLIKVNPPGSSTASVTKPQSEIVEPEPVETEVMDSSLTTSDSTAVEVDFSTAFDSLTDTSSSVMIDSSCLSPDYPQFKVNRRKVRIALQRNVKTAQFLATENIRLKSSSVSIVFRADNISVKSSRKGMVLLSGSRKFKEVSLPCTLFSTRQEECVKVNQVRYRGDIVFWDEKDGTFSIINYIDVEQYLRGVVPLEIGKRSESLIEALKAQAVAARTYTYKRMMERRSASFDMTATVQDQVYGGADPEYRESDLAIKDTENLIMICAGSLVNAYYHSTCGGKTANIEDVWQKPYCSYLRSISDLDSSGQPYCRISPRFSWQEKWTKRLFFDQIQINLTKLYPERKLQGDLKDISIKGFFSCGRVKSCTFSANDWSVDIGGDRLRFILLRDTPEKSILRSANFKILSLGPDQVLISGTGYGHGVGMCQMGALGRAGAGQSFEEILNAYYSGVNLCTAIQQD